MAIYELRDYAVIPGKMGEVTRLYETEGFAALAAGGFDANLVGYFIGDAGALNRLTHLWKFEDDAARRDFWKRLFADTAFMAFAVKLRPMLQHQENRLMLPATWGPQP